MPSPLERHAARRWLVAGMLALGIGVGRMMAAAAKPGPRGPYKKREAA